MKQILLGLVFGLLIICSFIPSSANAQSTPGDANGDNQVDLQDYNLVISYFGLDVPVGTMGDVNLDSQVNLYDYNLVVSHFGQSNPPTPTPSPHIALTRSEILPQLFPQGSWHQPASEIPILQADVPGDDASTHPYVNRFYHFTSDRPGNINLSNRSYTYPIYIATTDSPLREVHLSETYCNDALSNCLCKPINGQYQCTPEQQVPFSTNATPSWLPSTGSDGQIIIIDPYAQKYFDIFQLNSSSIPGTGPLLATNGSYIIDYSQHTGANQSSRGSGIAYAAMLVYPEEVASGVIQHALSMSGVPITANRPNGTCTGTACYNHFVPPANKTDGVTSVTSGNGIPMGTRYKLTLTNQQIDSYVNSKPANLRLLARTIVTALVDYGWVITDTGNSAFLQLEDIHSAGAAWTEITQIQDFTNDTQYLPFRDLLDGIPWVTRDNQNNITAYNFVVLEPR